MALTLHQDHRDIKPVRSQVLREIITLCHQNVLDLLGSSSAVVSRAGRRKRVCLSKTLCDAITALRSIGARTQHQTSIDQLENLGTLVRYHEDCRDFQRQGCLLEDILNLCRRLVKSTNLSNLLNLLPNKSLGPSTRSSMARRIAKLGQYASISKQLCSLALEVPALAAMRATPVMLPPETFRIAVPANYKPDLSTALARSVGKSTGLSATLDDICRKLSTTTQKASKKFTKDVESIHRGAKCHAEVQILFEYEICPRYPAPRVVASSKSACYLCNALFRAHGTYYIPRTHGRLYRGWKLPAVHLATMEGVEAEFANALERAIGESLKSLLNNHGPFQFHYPNESTLTIRSSSSLQTVSTASVSVAPTPVLETLDPQPAQTNDNIEAAAVDSQGCLDVSHESRPAASNHPAEQMEQDHSLVLHPDTEERLPRKPTPTDLSPGTSPTAPGGTEHTIITLQQGKVRRISLHPGYSPIIRTRHLYVHIEWPTKSMGQERLDDSRITLMAKWLSAEEADRHKSAQSIHEAQNLSTEFETECSSNEDVVLGLGDEIIELRRTEN